jgi:hypothetical protein
MKEINKMSSRSQPCGDGTQPIQPPTAEPSAAERLVSALATYDAYVAKCPVNNFEIDRRVYGPNDKCSACGAQANGNCGKESIASYYLVAEVRAIAKAEGQS